MRKQNGLICGISLFCKNPAQPIPKLGMDTYITTRQFCVQTKLLGGNRAGSVIFIAMIQF